MAHSVNFVQMRLSSTAVAGEVARICGSEGAAQVSIPVEFFLARRTARTPSAFASLQHLPRFAVEDIAPEAF